MGRIGITNGKDLRGKDNFEIYVLKESQNRMCEKLRVWYGKNIFQSIIGYLIFFSIYTTVRGLNIEVDPGIMVQGTCI